MSMRSGSCVSFSNVGGPLGAEVTQALFYGKVQCEAIDYMYGLGGRDLLDEHAERIVNELQQVVIDGGHDDFYRYIGIRE